MKKTDSVLIEVGDVVGLELIPHGWPPHDEYVFVVTSDNVDEVNTKVQSGNYYVRVFEEGYNA